MSKNIKLDLNGHTIASNPNVPYTIKNNLKDSVLTVTDSSVDGSGRIINSNEEGIAIWARLGDVVIEGGTIENNSDKEATVYVGTTNAKLEGANPKIIVKNGVIKNNSDVNYAYKPNTHALALNVINNMTPENIRLEGGKIYNQDPSLGDDNMGGTFIAEGCGFEVINEGDDKIYHIINGYAKIGQKVYATLNDAIQNVRTNEVIDLCTDINLGTETLTFESEVPFTLNLNGHSIVSDGSVTLKNNGARITLDDTVGTGLVKNTMNSLDSGIAVWARLGGFDIINGTYETQSRYEATIYMGTKKPNYPNEDYSGAIINIYGGKFTNVSEDYEWKDGLHGLVLNVYNSLSTDGIKVFGGKFYSQNPMLGDDNMGGTFLGEGCQVISIENGFEVIK